MQRFRLFHTRYSMLCFPAVRLFGRSVLFDAFLFSADARLVETIEVDLLLMVLKQASVVLDRIRFDFLTFIFFNLTVVLRLWYSVVVLLN